MNFLKNTINFIGATYGDVNEDSSNLQSASHLKQSVSSEVDKLSLPVKFSDQLPTVTRVRPARRAAYNAASPSKQTHNAALKTKIFDQLQGTSQYDPLNV